MKTLQKWKRAIVIGVLMAVSQTLGAVDAASEVVLVVSPQAHISSLTAEQVTDIFLGKTATFPNGVRVIPIDQEEGTLEREAFYKEYIGKTAAQLRIYWSKIVFTGKGYPPTEVAPPDRVKRVVRDNPNYIGYINRRDVDGSVKVIVVQRP